MCTIEQALLVDFVNEWESLFGSLYDHLFIGFNVDAVVYAELCEFFDSEVNHCFTIWKDQGIMI